MSFQGFSQVQHRALLEDFEDSFFEKIGTIFVKKSRFIAEAYYNYLQPNNKADDKTIQKFRDLLAKVTKDTPDNSHLIGLVKTSIHDLGVAMKGKELSQKFMEANLIA
jgi:hypothetical protein